VLESLTDAIRAEIEHATEVVADKTARAARGGALIGGAIGGLLFGIILALGIIIGRIGS
jgi:predicted lipid-binding transport protein (Tim44 family)